MPRAFFDHIEDGGIPVYGQADKYAVVREGPPYWFARHMDLDFASPTLVSKAIVQFFEFDPTNKLQQFIRRRISEMRVEGTFVIPFRPSRKKGIFAQYSLAGLAFFPDGYWSRGHHFEGSAKEIASWSFRILHPEKNSNNPIVHAVERSREEKARLRVPLAVVQESVPVPKDD
jgi:hypothetical protein